jgi:hypothetical protein
MSGEKHPGSDQNPGSIARPWKTIQHAADTLIAGDTVYIRGGTYNELVDLTHKGGGNGTDYVTYQNYPGETVILDGTGIDIQHGGGLFHISSTDAVRVSGLRIQNSNGTGIYVGYSDNIIVENISTYNTVKSGVGIWYSNQVVVDGNNVELACNAHPGYIATEEPITINGGSYVEVKNNVVHDGPVLPPGGAGGEGINTKVDAHHVYVHHNLIYNLPGKPGISVDAWYYNLHDVYIYDNISHHNGMGILVENEGDTGSAVNVHVYNNILYNNRYAGIYLPDYMQDGLKQDIYIVNNTTYGNGTYGIDINSANLVNVVIRNNIMSENASTIHILDGAKAQCFIDHNLYYGNGSRLGSDYVDANPRFVNPEGINFQLQNGSPAIDAGSSLGAPDSDFDGQPRPQGPSHDIGAYEMGHITSFPLMR